MAGQPAVAAPLPQVRREGKGGGVGWVGGGLEKGRIDGLQHSAPPLPLGQLSGASSRSIGRRSFKGGDSLTDQARLVVQCSTSVSNSPILNGLERYASHPLASICTSSPDMANAVTAMIGIMFV